MKSIKIHYSILFLLAAAFFGCRSENKKEKTTQDVFDIVIENGQVIDPETNTDQILNVGIKDGTIAKLSGETILL